MAANSVENNKNTAWKENQEDINEEKNVQQ